MLRLAEAAPVDPQEYASQLYDLLAKLGTLTGEAETGMIEILEEARARIEIQIAEIPWDSPSRVMLERAKAGVDQTMANLAEKMGTTVADLQAQGHAIGVDLAIKPLGGERGFEVVAANVTLDQLQIMQAYSADLVQDISDQLRKRINGEITSVIVGAKTPFAAAKAIGKNLVDPNHFSSIAHRARAIVVTEVGRAQSLGTQAAQDALQRALFDAGDPTEVRKRWLNAHLPGARATHLEAEARYAPDGEKGPIPVNAFYEVGGFKAYYPKDPSLPPSESVHCHCVSLTVLDEGSTAVAGNAQQLAQAKANYSTAKTDAAAGAVAKTKPALNKPATAFLEDPYTAAGLQPVKTLKTGGTGYGGQIMAQKLGYPDPTDSGFVWSSELGAWKHPLAPAGKQLPDFGKLKPGEQLGLMKSAGLSSVTKNQIIKHLDIDASKSPSKLKYAATKPAATPPTPKKPTPVAPPPRTVRKTTRPTTAPTGERLAAVKAAKPTAGKTAPTVPGAQKFTRHGANLTGKSGTLGVDTALKDKIMRELGDALDTAFDSDRLEAFAEAYPRRYGIPGLPNTSGEKVASMLVKTWAATSGDAYSGSLAVQRAIAKRFDLDWPPVGYTNSGAQITAVREAEAFYDKWSDILDTFVEAQYQNTQTQLAELGYGDTIRLVRGMEPGDLFAYSQQGSTRQVMLNPASSFSINPQVARGFGQVRYYCDVPRERILGSALTGFGCYTEYEFVVIGSKTAEEMWAVRG